MRSVRFYCLLPLLSVALPAHALRPFDGTDAAVADAGEFELEYGPFARLREDGQRFWLAPVLVANWGMHDGRELVLEGKRRTSDGSMFDMALSLKQLHRDGVLQGADGASIASECGLLLPGVRAEHGTGAGCALIVSERWRNVMVHLNSSLAYSRDHRWSPAIGAIFGFPSISRMQPVMELLVQKVGRDAPARSALAGVIWKHSENFSVDIGVKRVLGASSSSSELRFGITWTNSPS